MLAVEKHPQRQQIIDAILAGEPVRQIAARLKPPLHHATIARYRSARLAEAVSHLHPKSDKLSIIKDIAIAAANPADAQAANERVDASLRRELTGRVQHRLDRRERWISAAENEPIRDPETGEVIGKSLNHKALAAHDKNEGSDIEFLARLGGLLTDHAQVNITAVMQIGEAPQVIDVTPIEVDETR